MQRGHAANSSSERIHRRLRDEILVVRFLYQWRNDDLWHRYRGNQNVGVPGFQLVPINDCMSAVLNRQAELELSDHIANSRGSSFLYHNQEFWQKALFRAGVEIECFVKPYIEIGAENLHNGILALNLSTRYGNRMYERLFYDIVAGQFTGPVLHGYYAESLGYLTAAAQEDADKPDAYQELARINRFLKEKKSVTLHFRDGTSVRHKSDSMAASRIMALGKNGLPHLTVDLPYGTPADKRRIENLVALQHGHSRLEVNANRLIGIEAFCNKACA